MPRPLITGIKTNMLLNVFLGLIANLEPISGEFKNVSLKRNDFCWIKPRISVLTRFLLQAAVKTEA